MRKPSKGLLSHRQEQILSLLCAGYNTYEIGSRLRISKHTVAVHKQYLYRKLDVKSAEEAIRAAVDHGFLSWNPL